MRASHLPLVLAVVATVQLGALSTGLTHAAAAAAAEPPPVAWTVQTVDNGNGSARANFAYDLEPGEVVRDAMRVTNTGSVALPLDVYAADAFTTPTGELDLPLGDEKSSDAGLWVTPAVKSLKLQPGASADIDFTIRVPADARPGDHPAGLVTSYRSQDTGQTVSVDRRLGSRINLRVAGDLVPAATVTDVRSSYAANGNPFAPGTVLVDYTLTNTGNTRITAGDSLTTSGPFGALTTYGAPHRVGEIMPGSHIDVHRELPAASIGWLSGHLQVEAEGVGIGTGSIEPVVVELSIAAVPWTLAALVLFTLAACAVLVWLILRGRRRARSARTGTTDVDAAAD